MSRVKIVGGGLTGILAAFQAHAMGAVDIELHERFDNLGGVALPDVRNGLEMREGCIYFGPSTDPIRALLETHGLEFQDFDNRFGSLSPGDIYIEDFGGPGFACADITLTAPVGPSLADRLDCYPAALRDPLVRYAHWHLGCDLSTVHESAATPLAINRSYPVGADLETLAEAKRTDPLANELLAIPRHLWGHTNNLQASLPVGGFPTLLRGCRRALEAIGVAIHERDLVSPRQALAEHAGEVLVWAANPTPLFKAAGVPVPRLLPKSFATYTFEARWTGALPFYVQNFTAEGSCFRVYVYESGGKTLLTAECVAEDGGDELSWDIHRLLKGFEGDLTLGDLLAASIKPRWIYHTVDAIERLTQLRATLAERVGPAFVAGAWEPYAKGEKFVDMDAALSAALGVSKAKAAA
ncbi:flagellin modification protein FlmF [Phenylobacterium sp.]|uniref:flagellin modification protein FlmF n=1 Tax=Phenylobacterium sp. TaxID=1871053 RepID=UPI003BA871F9